ncbi:MAG: phosphate acyltransferase [Gemmatimonadota bacterium]
MAELRRRARRRDANIGFPEADDERTAAAMARLEAERIGTATAVRAPRGHGPDEALELAVSRLARGELDGVVAGAVLPTAEVIRAGLRHLGLAPGTTTVSSCFYMVLARPSLAGTEVLSFTDPGVVPCPTADQLAESAEAACRARRRVVGDEPRVAFLSYSTLGSAGGESVEKVREAVRAFRLRCPEVAADGELQADAALVPDVARRKAPGSEVAGAANVLVFPGLDAANIAYKLVQRLAGAVALGPILQGFARPLNDLSRGASVEDIVHVTCITSLMAAGRARRELER